MLRPKILVLAWLVTLAAMPAASAFGQWTTQTIPLRPGWNAVFLEVQPEPDDSTAVFQGMPIESVWMWNRRFSSVQFIQDATTLVPEQPEWLHYYPPDSGKDFLTNLFIIQGGRSYLIKLGGGQPVNWAVKGRPVVRPTDWTADSFNLVGLNVDSNSPPTFKNFFAPSAAHSGQSAYRLNASGLWETVSDPASETIQPGTAYWVYCKGGSNYSGPLRLILEQGGGIDFGRILTEQTLRIKNETLVAKQVTLTKQTSEAAPPGAALLAGDVLLTYWKEDTSAWVDFPGALVLAVGPGEELGLRVGVKRKDMPGTAGALYQSLLGISDGQGYRSRLAVVAKGLTAGGSISGLRALEDGSSTVDRRAGLWVGTATVDKVSFPADPSESERMIPKPTGSEFQFRLILHVDGSGQAKLLQKVILMWKEGTLKPDPSDPGKQIVAEPGRFVLVTREDLISQFRGAALRDGQTVGRRISSPAFSFSEQVPMNGNFDGTLVSSAIALDYDDPLNPFKHKYHPHHDNLDYDFKTKLPEGRESYSIVRNIELAFTTDDPEGLRLSGWGDNQVGGVYRERIQGVHRKELRVEGTFRLNHVSRVAVLNDGL